MQQKRTFRKLLGHLLLHKFILFIGAKAETWLRKTALVALMLLYVLCFEPLAHRIRFDPHIDGLRLPGSRDEARFSGYADNATTFVLNVKSIYKDINLFNNFGMAS